MSTRAPTMARLEGQTRPQRRSGAPKRGGKRSERTHAQLDHSKLQSLAAKAKRGRGPRISGHGAYSISDIAGAVTRPFLDSTASVGAVNRLARGAGEAFGDYTKVPGAGRLLGNAASWLSRVFGFGDYKINSNSLCATGAMNMSSSGGPSNIPEFSSSPSRGSIRVKHREFVSDVLSTNAFTNTSYLLNPGNPLLWPWLANIANNFENFKLHGCIFEFKSESAFAVGSGASTAMGTVVMATDYDVIDNNYQNKREMEICEFATSGTPVVNQIHPIECDPKQLPTNTLYIQQGVSTLAGYPDDPRFSCVGNMQIATVGMPAAANGSIIGELWVSYDVELLKPQLTALSNPAINTVALHAYGLAYMPGSSQSPTVISSGLLPVTVTATNNLIIITNTGGMTGQILLTYRTAASTATMSNSVAPPTFAGTAAELLGFHNSTGTLVSGNNTYVDSTVTIGTLSSRFSFGGTTADVATYAVPYASAAGTGQYDLYLTLIPIGVAVTRRTQTRSDRRLAALEAALSSMLPSNGKDEVPPAHGASSCSSSSSSGRVCANLTDEGDDSPTYVQLDYCPQPNLNSNIVQNPTLTQPKVFTRRAAA
jgi:hypothetical protein